MRSFGRIGGDVASSAGPWWTTVFGHPGGLLDMPSRTVSRSPHAPHQPV